MADDTIKTTVSLSVNVGKALTAVEQAAIDAQNKLNRTLYPEYYKMQDKITALITEIRLYNAKTQNKKINKVTLDMLADTMSQEETP